MGAHVLRMMDPDLRPFSACPEWRENVLDVESADILKHSYLEVTNDELLYRKWNHRYVSRLHIYVYSFIHLVRTTLYFSLSGKSKKG